VLEIGVCKMEGGSSVDEWLSSDATSSLFTANLSDIDTALPISNKL